MISSPPSTSSSRAGCPRVQLPSSHATRRAKTSSPRSSRRSLVLSSPRGCTTRLGSSSSVSTILGRRWIAIARARPTGAPSSSRAAASRGATSSSSSNCGETTSCRPRTPTPRSTITPRPAPTSRPSRRRSLAASGPKPPKSSRLWRLTKLSLTCCRSQSTMRPRATMTRRSASICAAVRRRTPSRCTRRQTSGRRHTAWRLSTWRTRTWCGSTSRRRTGWSRQASSRRQNGSM
mmetsp:Transcript_21230/g.42961  ORF Transcript_21230/g.42961 Transcript_21230/m.42961 type:complete len:234 (+) Transcript_21230:1569-2270(+)